MELRLLYSVFLISIMLRKLYFFGKKIVTDQWLLSSSIRTLRSPRKKEAEALPRSFSYFYWVPNHLLVLAVSAIFAILNPLVLGFNLAYFSFALVVFKNQVSQAILLYLS